MSKQTVLVTGGAGYIGSHTVLCLLEAGYQPVVVDNYCNASAESLRRVAELTQQKFTVVELDVRDAAAVGAVFDEHRPAAVIHFAGLKAVGESVEQPLSYYDCNVGGAITLLQQMHRANCHRFVFSSSATVYGLPDRLPIAESESIKPTNPYGHTKAVIETIIQDHARATPEFKAISLRYFNPVGAHPSGRIGEAPQGRPNNLMPYIAQVAVGRRQQLDVYGDDWPTPDGTGVRDYIHVMDLAEGHIAALVALQNLGGVTPINLGTGQGHSVLEMVENFARASGRDVPWRIVPRRDGDIATCFASTERAQQLLNWGAQRDVATMCADAWRWQSNNPDGYS